MIHPKAQDVFETVSQKPHYTNKLSKREIEVLREMVKGKTNKEIAETLFVSEKKQLKHMSVIYLVNYKLAIVHKQQFMQWKIS